MKPFNTSPRHVVSDGSRIVGIILVQSSNDLTNCIKHWLALFGFGLSRIESGLASQLKKQPLVELKGSVQQFFQTR